MRVLLAALLVAAAFSGCTSAHSDDDAHDETMPPAPREVLAVTLAAAPPWVKPGEEVQLDAVSAHATRFSWWLEAHPGESNVRDTGELQPGVFSDPISLDKAGLHRFHCHPHPWMTLDVIVRDDAALRGTQHVALVDGATNEAYAFVPDELVVAPGTKLVFWNNGTVMHTATHDAHLQPIGEGASLRFRPQTAGDHDVVVLARDGARGLGEARARLVVDAEKPDAVQALGAWTGEFQAAAPGRGEAQTFAFDLAFAAAKLDLSFTVTSATPVPATARATLAREGGAPIAEAAPAAEGALAAADLPAGRYVLTLIPEQGVLGAFEAGGAAHLVLAPPARAPDGAHGHHHHAH